ncbi:ABC transporter permease [Actinopolymorpha pittospori]|uniref:ABC-2 type transport system permease protein n=1 Tax=Actinopolymorpha pittospori TaxID=648752 RepID=A0A927N1R4_9ACTN|nr:ABC transporter permease [Actinopolymorpha pittospori]MBE1611060.1 ABC-2 type transport system permease protein [Actinopolymorpha pittospori]
MTVGTFTPRPGAAPLPRMVLGQALMEAKLLLRNGEQVVLALVIPLLLLAAGTLAPGLALGPGRRIDVLAPGVLALAVMSTAFTSLAIATAFERRYGVLKRLGVSPLPRTGLLAGKVLAVLLVEAVQVVLIVAAGLLLGWRPEASVATVGPVVVLVIAGTAAFGALGLLMAGTLRAEATLAAANLVYLLLVVCGATLVPVHSYPEAMQPVIGWLPSGALAEGMRQAFGPAGPSWSAVAGAIGILLAWAVAGALATARTFRWE